MSFANLNYAQQRFIKKAVRYTILLGLFEGTRRVLQNDNLNSHYLSGTLQGINDTMRDIHQHVRKRELLAKIHGEVLELNAGSGKTLPLLSPYVSRYYANEPNPFLAKQVMKQAHNYAMPVAYVEPTDSLTFLKKMDSNSLDGIIMNGGLRYEKDDDKIDRIFQETYRVLRPGGTLYFAEDTEFSHQFAPFRTIRTALRNYFLSEHTHDFVPQLLKVYESAYVEDWTKPHLGYNKDQREGVKVLLPYNQRETDVGNIAIFRQNIPAFSPSWIHRPFLGGYAIKRTTINKSDDILVKGFPTMDKIVALRDTFEMKEYDRQWVRDHKAQEGGKDIEQKIESDVKKNQEREAMGKPSAPRGGYQDNQLLHYNVFSGEKGLF